MTSPLLGFRVDNLIGADQAGIAKSYGDTVHIYVGGLLLEQLGWDLGTPIGILVDQTGYRIALAPDRRGSLGSEVGTAFGDDPCPPRRFDTQIGPTLSRVFQQERWQRDDVVVCGVQIPSDDGVSDNVVILHPSEARPAGVLLIDLPRGASSGAATAALSTLAHTGLSRQDTVVTSAASFTWPPSRATSAIAAGAFVFGLFLGVVITPNKIVERQMAVMPEIAAPVLSQEPASLPSAIGANVEPPDNEESVKPVQQIGDLHPMQHR